MRKLKRLKKYADDLKFWGWWFNNNRATNELSGKRAIAAFGAPYVNVGVVEDEYLTLFGNLDGFDDYYQNLVNSEILQLVGRQRPHLYPNQQFVLYQVGTGIDLSFLTPFGIKVVYRHGIELTPDAGTRGQGRKLAMVEFALQLVRAEQDIKKLTQGTLAKGIGCGQQNI
ncbi:MAG: hypothetical protein AB4426_25155 [Xenococcaceae cyanobacterium]